MKKSRNKFDLSIVILNYNTKELLKRCLESIEKVKSEAELEVVVVDNGSTDRSLKMLESFDWVKVVENGKNLGFAAGNNAARSLVRGRYILFLNSDTEVCKGTLKKSLRYIEKHKDVGAVTCRMKLPNGKDDRDARRSFPTPWVALTHFLYLDRVFPKSSLFSRYWYGHIPPSETIDIEVLQGAYCLVSRKLMEELEWFDEDYFLDGEDIDLSWRIWEKGYRIVYLSNIKILHVKGATKGKRKARRNVAFTNRIKYVTRGVDSMKIFYRKHLSKHYPTPVNYLIYLAIELKKFQRIVKVLVSYLV